MGNVVDGRYRLLEKLGSGGMGGVYLAEQLNLGRQIALKVLHNDAAADPIARERFVREARAVCHLKHPNLVVYHDFGTDSETGRLYLAMEHLQGRSLSSLTTQTTPIPIDRVIHIIDQLCGALSVAHRDGVIHRDLKPGNVMLVRRENDKDFVKLIDFGISRVLKGSEVPGQSEMDLTKTGMLIGTTAYLAPEYIRNQVVDERVDLYALGIIAYEMIAGRRPFEATDQVQMLMKHVNEAPIPLQELSDGRQVPDPLSDVILKALEKDPQQRYSTVDAFRKAFLQAAHSLLDESSIGATLQHQIPESILGAADSEVDIAVMPTLALGGNAPKPVGTEPTLSTVVSETLPLPPARKRRIARGWMVTFAALLVVGLVAFAWLDGRTPTSEPPPKPVSLVLPPAIALMDMPTREHLHIESAAGASLPGRRPAQSEQRREAPREPSVEKVEDSGTAEAPPTKPVAPVLSKKQKLSAALSRAKKGKIAGNWRAVIRSYRDAYKLQSSSRYLKQIGLAQIKAGKRGEACRTFQRYIKRTARTKRADAMERLAVYGCNLSM